MKKYFYLVEIPLFFLFLLAVNYYFAPEFIAFAGVNPHPFWIAIIIFAVRYGFIAGIVSGFVGASLYLLLTWYLGERYLFEDKSFYVLPSLFVLMSVFIGQFASKQEDQLKRHQKAEKELKDQVKFLKDEVKVLSKVNHSLEKRVASKMSTLITVYEGARSLESLDLDRLYPAILKFMIKTLGAEEAALYLMKDGKLKLESNYGWKDYQNWPKTYEVGKGLTGKAYDKKKIVTVKDMITEKINSSEMMGDALFAGPITLGEKGDVIGVVSIQSLPFLSFNSSSINLFQFLLKWASRSIERAIYIESLEEGEVIDPEFQIYSYRYFESRSRQEYLRSQTYYLPLSVGLVEVPDLQLYDEDTRMKYLSLLCEILRTSLREMDVLARYPDSRRPFIFLLITASKKQSEEIEKKIKEEFSRLKGLLENNQDDIPHLGLASFKPQIKDFPELVKEASQSLAS